MMSTREQQPPSPTVSRPHQRHPRPAVVRWARTVRGWGSSRLAAKLAGGCLCALALIVLTGWFDEHSLAAWLILCPVYCAGVCGGGLVIGREVLRLMRRKPSLTSWPGHPEALQPEDRADGTITPVPEQPVPSHRHGPAEAGTPVSTSPTISEGLPAFLDQFDRCLEALGLRVQAELGIETGRGMPLWEQLEFTQTLHVWTADELSDWRLCANIRNELADRDPAESVMDLDQHVRWLSDLARRTYPPAAS